MLRWLPLMLLLSVGALGCTESVDSEDILTSGIHATLNAEIPCAGEAVLTAEFKVGARSNVYVELGGDDVLTAWAGEQSQRMGPVTTVLSEQVSYSARMPAQDADLVYKIAFDRSLDDGAPDSTVQVSAASMAMQPSGQSLSRAADAFTLNWTGGSLASQIQVSATGPCIEDLHQTLSSDPGTLSFAANSLQTRMVVEDGSVVEDGGMPFDASHPVMDDCTVTLSLMRRYIGSLDPGYGEGGSFNARQLCTLEFTSTP